MMYEHKKKKRKLFQEATGIGLGLTGTSVALGVGASVAEKAGGQGVGGITTLSSHMPLMGNIAGAGLAVGALRGLTDSVETKKKKRKGNLY